MEVIRTVKVKIDLDITTANNTIDEWTKVCNYISKIAFSNDCLSNQIKLHRLTYQDIREKFNLSSQVSASAIKQVASKYATARTNRVKLKRAIKFN